MTAEQPRSVVGWCIFCPPSRSITAKRYGYSETEGAGSWTYGPAMRTLCATHDRHSRLTSLALWASNRAHPMALLRFDAIRLVRFASAIGKGPHIDAEMLLALGRGATEDEVRACLRPGRRPPLRAAKRPRGKERRKARRYMATDQQEARVQALFNEVGTTLQHAIDRTDWRVISVADLDRLRDECDFCFSAAVWIADIKGGEPRMACEDCFNTGCASGYLLGGDLLHE